MLCAWIVNGVNMSEPGIIELRIAVSSAQMDHSVVEYMQWKYCLCRWKPGSLTKAWMDCNATENWMGTNSYQSFCPPKALCDFNNFNRKILTKHFKDESVDRDKPYRKLDAKQNFSCRFSRLKVWFNKMMNSDTRLYSAMFFSQSRELGGKAVIIATRKNKLLFRIFW